MKNNKKILVILTVLVLMMPTFARDLSLDEAVSCALENNLQLQGSEIDLRMTEIAYKYSYNALMPTANATATFQRANEERAGINTSKNEVLFTYGISGSWSFNPAMITSIRLAYENYNNGQITYEQACNQMKQNVRKLYFSVVLQQEALKIKEATLKAQQDRYIQAQKDYENGLIPEIALLQSRVTYENAKPSYEEARIGLESAKRQLAFVLGLDINESLNLTTSIEHEFINIDLDDALAQIPNRYDIRSLEVSGKLLKLQKEALIESTLLPSISLQASWQPTLLDIDMKGKDSWMDNGSISGTVAWNLTNLLPSSNQYKNYSDLKNGQKKYENGKQMAYDNAKMEIINLVEKLRQVEETLVATESTVDVAQKNYDARLISFYEGTSDYLDLQDAENQLSQAELGRLSNRFNYISALIDLETATGKQLF